MAYTRRRLLLPHSEDCGCTGCTLDRHPDDCDCPACTEWRTVHVGRQVEARPSRQAERAFARDAHEQQQTIEQEHRAEVDRLADRAQDALEELRSAVAAPLGRLDRRTFQGFDRARRFLMRLRNEHGSADTLER